MIPKQPIKAQNAGSTQSTDVTTLLVPDDSISGGVVDLSAGGAMIGSVVTGATDGSVLFAGTAGILAQDNANLFYDSTLHQMFVNTLIVGPDLTAFDPTYPKALYVSKTGAATSAQEAVHGQIETTSGSGGSITGGYFAATTTSPSTNTSIYGAQAFANSNTATGNAIGFFGSASQVSGNATNLFGVKYSVALPGAGTATDMYGALLQTNIYGTGTATRVHEIACQSFLSGPGPATWYGLHLNYLYAGTPSSPIGTMYSLYIDTARDAWATTGWAIYVASSLPSYFAGNVQIADKNIVLGTTTGTKIGTATGQKLAFWNQTPVVQQVLATGAGHTVDDVITLLQTLGLCKQS